MQSEAPIIQCAFRLSLEVSKLVHNFPLKYRSTLCLNLFSQVFVFLDKTIEANYTQDPTLRVDMVNSLLAISVSLRLKLRIARQLKIMSHGQHTVFNSEIENIQRQLAGWKKWILTSMTKNKNEPIGIKKI